MTDKAKGITITKFCPHCQLPTQDISVPYGSLATFENLIEFLGQLDVVDDFGYFYTESTCEKIGGATIGFKDETSYVFYIDHDKDIMIVQKEEEKDEMS